MQTEHVIDFGLETQQQEIWGYIRHAVLNKNEDELYTDVVETVFMQIQGLIIQELAKRQIISCASEDKCFQAYNDTGLSQKFRETWREKSGKDKPMTGSTVGQYVVYQISIGKEKEALDFAVARLTK